VSYVPAIHGRPQFSTYRRRGLSGANYYDLLAQAGLKDCDPRDSQCVADNQAKQAAVETFWAAVLATGNPEGAENPPDFSHITGNVQQFMADQPLAVPPEIVQAANAVTEAAGVPSVAVTVAAPVTAVALKPGTLSFHTSRGGTALQTGDTWTVSIQGASPNIQVSVKGGKDGAVSQTSMGTTDANGNFSVSGTFGSGEIGNWAEQWYVGSVLSGSFSFTVSQATTADGKKIIVSNGADQAPGAKKDTTTTTTSSFTDWLQASMLGGGIPNWAVLAGGLVAVLYFGGQRGR
jgi:hypothetical protein